VQEVNNVSVPQFACVEIWWRDDHRVSDRILLLFSVVLHECLKLCVNAGDGSNSCWAEMEQFVIGTYPMFPLTIDMQQRLILHYLQPMGEYQEVTSVER